RRARSPCLVEAQGGERAPDLHRPSLHDALPICVVTAPGTTARARRTRTAAAGGGETQTRRLSLSADEFGLEGSALVVEAPGEVRSEEQTSELQSRSDLVCRLPLHKKKALRSIRT